jgi:uncharacterized protein YecT (DUF1311 family)
MSTDEFAPDLSKLDKDYQILTELHCDSDSHTYLARHLRLNRDVVITVVRAPDGDAGNALTHFAADARLLTAMRHPNVVPVIEGVWLDEKTFAIVRARVRGSTLDQLITAVGPVPIARVATTIQQVQAALAWARNGGVVHRRVAPEFLVFQQGNGRVLLSLGVASLPTGAMPDECDDAQTIGQLASDMLSGQLGGYNESSSGIVIPPQIVPAVAKALERVRQCDRDNASRAVDELLAALGAAAGHPSAPMEPVVNDTVSEHALVPDGSVAKPQVSSPKPVVTVRTPPARRPVPRFGARDDAVVVVRSSFGFNARLGTAVAVATIVAVLGLFVFRRADDRNVAASVATNDTTHQAAGDVALSPRPDTVATVPTYNPLPIIRPAAPPIQTPVETPQPPAISPANPPANASSRAPIIPVDTPKREPPRATPPSAVVTPPPSVAPTSSRDSATAAASTTDVCASPEDADQHKCLMAAIDRNDRELNGVYAKLIQALRRQANAATGDPDPDSVDQLRGAQRKWVDERDVACRDVGDGPLYARSRSSCFAQYSANRARELQRMLDAVPPTLERGP